MSHTATRPRYSRESAHEGFLAELALPPVADLAFTFAWGPGWQSVTHNADPVGAWPVMDWPQFGSCEVRGDNEAKRRQRYGCRTGLARRMLALALRAHKCEVRGDAGAQLVHPIPEWLVKDFAREFLGGMDTSGVGERVVSGEEIMDYVFAWRANEEGKKA